MLSHDFWFELLELRLLLSSAYDLIGVTQLRNDPAFKNIDGRGVSVVVIDTGLDTAHPLISPNFITGLDVVSGASTPTVTNPHGTHVAGIIGSKPDPTRDYDGGVAPGVGLIAINVFSQGAGGDVSASNDDIDKALQWVIANQRKYNIVAVNMSLGSGFYTSPSQVTGDVYAGDLTTLQNNGVTIVSAAGNSYGLVQDPNTGQTENVEFPNAAAPGILSTLDVGAVWDANEGSNFIWANGSVDVTTGPDRITSFSQRPPEIKGIDNGIFAPGAIITSTWPGNQLQPDQGTSQATPMVTGAVALMQDAAETFGGRLLSPIEIRNILTSTGDQITDGDDEDDAVFVDSNGNGVVDPGELQAMKNTGLNFPRMDIFKALKKIAAMFGAGSGASISGDQNGTLSGAILGPTLNGSPVEPIEGVLGTDGNKAIGNRDVDMYQFTVTSPGKVSIQIASDPQHKADFNSYLRIFNSSGKQIAANDDNGGSGFSALTITLTPGTYYAGVSGAGNTSYDPFTDKGLKAGKSGNFEIGFSLKSSDPNGLLSSATAVSLVTANNGSQTFEGNIGSDLGKAVALADVDLYKITVPDNGKLLVDIDTPFNAGFVDSYLRVFDSSGNDIGDSDNDVSVDVNNQRTELTDGTFDYDASTNQVIGHFTDSFVIGDVSRGDVYYFGVSDASNTSYSPTTLAGRPTAGAGGLYDITLSFVNNDLNGSIPQAVQTTALPVNSILGSIGTDLGQDVGDRDVDMFKITPSSAGILNINVDSYAQANNTNPVDTVLKLFSSSGTLMATVDDVNGPDPLMQISVPPNQNYYAAVAGKGNENFNPFELGSGSPGATGFYNVSINELASSVAGSLSDDAIGDGALGTITLGQHVSGTVGMDNGFVRGASDVDLYKFVPTASGAVEIRAGNIDAFGADTYLRLFDANGNQIAANDNAGGNTVNSRIQATLIKGTTYYVGVSGSGNTIYSAANGTGTKTGSAGAYVLMVDGDFAKVASGQLQVSGTGGNDAITIGKSGKSIKAVRNGSTLIFTAASVTSYFVSAGDGEDDVTIGAGILGTYIDGGAGNDLLNGGNGNDTLTAGAGKNTLLGNNGDDRLNGSGGRDSIVGGGGNDRLYGNAGDDTLDGGGGIDRLFGGDGNDALFGGGSNDKLYGEAGNDTLNGQGEADLNNGGPGHDTAAKDVLDSDTSIESLI
ncbi:MAG TPA: DVUA0089 family protein [Tepidisphaeraceae bacterium]|jgi:hypothetical protein|nr:DVUA0089 family protein [Tepidisphaeraceae bacterium]